MQDGCQLVLENWGLIDYEACLLRQQRLHAEVVAERHAGAILCVEHPAVLTMGKHAEPRHLKFAESYLSSLGISIYRIDRGGEVTAHEPGQLVVYPILRLPDFGLMPRCYVALLEDAVIATLGQLGIHATQDVNYPGVWVGAEKICAIGVRIKDRVSLHGIALNVCNSLKTFDLIVPCGILGRGVTSVSRVLGRQVHASEVQGLLLDEIQKRMRSSVFSS